MENPVTEVMVFATSTCPWCIRTKKYLAAKGLLFTEVDVERDEAVFKQMAETTGWTAAPVLRVGETWILGFDPPAIERALSRAGLVARKG